MRLFLRLGILLLGLLGTASFSESRGGYGEGNGGDTSVFDFLASAADGAALAHQWDLIDLATFAKLNDLVLESTVSFTQQELYLRGERKDAINFPDEKRIIVFQPAWDALGLVMREAFALHEFLGLARVDDSHYQISKKIAQIYGEDVGDRFNKLLAEIDQHLLHSAKMLRKQSLSTACFDFGMAYGKFNDLVTVARRLDCDKFEVTTELFVQLSKIMASCDPRAIPLSSSSNLNQELLEEINLIRQQLTKLSQ